MNETKREGYIRRIENALKTDVTEITHEIFFTEEATREILELLKEPSAKPKTGHWRKITAEEDEEMAFMGWAECSNCKSRVVIYSDFCPFCGADMRGEQDDKR